jgi:hypothetical protein
MVGARCRLSDTERRLRSGACRPSGRSGQPAQRRASLVRAPTGGIAVPPAASEASPGGYRGRPRVVRGLPHETSDDWGSGEPRARQARHQETIDASFDRAEAYERLGDFEHALEWLDRAAAVSGGLPPAYRAAARTLGSGGRGSTPAGRRGLERMTGPARDVASIAGARDPAQSLVFQLPARPAAVSAARRALLAANGGLPSAVRDDVLLLLTELVSNAVRHAEVGPGRAVRVELQQGGADDRGCGCRRRHQLHSESLPPRA